MKLKQHRSNRAFTLIELLVIVVIVAVLGSLLFGGCTRLFGSGSYSTGFRVGQLTKFSRKGTVNKSWEGELNAGGLRNSTGANGSASVVANLWPFSVDDDDKQVVADLQKAADTGKSVKLDYEEVRFNPPWIYDTAYRVKKVTLVE